MSSGHSDLQQIAKILLRPCCEDWGGGEGRGQLRAVPGAADELLTVKEVAALLKVSTATVYKLVDRGELPHVRVLSG